MPTFRHGKNAVFTIQDSGDVVRDISNVLKNISMPRQIDTAETTAFGSAAKSFVIGIPGATFSVDGMFDLTVDGYLNGIYAFETARAFVYGPEGSTASRRKFTGSCYLTDYSLSGSVSDMLSFTAQFQITGAVTATTY